MFWTRLVRLAGAAVAGLFIHSGELAAGPVSDSIPPVALVAEPAPAGTPPTGGAAEEAAFSGLLMVDYRGCFYCQRFKRDFKAELSCRSGCPDPEDALSVRIVSKLKKWPADLVTVTPAYATPTFILVEEGQEVGRFAGYRDPETFWRMLGPLLAEVKATTPPADESDPSQLPELERTALPPSGLF